MLFSEGMIHIVDNSNCPMYGRGDRFRLSGRALTPPAGKPTCLTLASDIVRVTARRKAPSEARGKKSPALQWLCSGPAAKCAGCVTFSLETGRPADASKTSAPGGDDIDGVIKTLKDFSLFQSMDEAQIRAIVAMLKMKKFPKGATVISKGEPGKKLYIILSGKVAVLDDGDVPIAVLEKGEVFGEMSLISGDPVTADIKAAEPLFVMFVDGRDFRNALDRFPSLQMYFARLLARRLAKTNIVVSRELASGMIGRLTDISPTELFQVLNNAMKTGLLKMDLPGGPAEIAFGKGDLLGARYRGLTGKDAFFAVLREKEGRFKFSHGLPEDAARQERVGDFMWLLMEGLRRMDDEIRRA